MNQSNFNSSHNPFQANKPCEFDRSNREEIILLSDSENEVAQTTHSKQQNNDDRRRTFDGNYKKNRNFNRPNNFHKRNSNSRFGRNSFPYTQNNIKRRSDNGDTNYCSGSYSNRGFQRESESNKAQNFITNRDNRKTRDFAAYQNKRKIQRCEEVHQDENGSIIVAPSLNKVEYQGLFKETDTNNQQNNCQSRKGLCDQVIEHNIAEEQYREEEQRRKFANKKVLQRKANFNR